jgi:BMFP domain-containing protein YqiC
MTLDRLDPRPRNVIDFRHIARDLQIGVRNRVNLIASESRVPLILIPLLERELAENVMSQSKVFEDFARLMTDATEMAHGVRREAETAMKSQFERWLTTMDVVSRDEFEVVKQMALKLFEENEKLGKRIADLEAKLTTKGKASTSKEGADSSK